MIKRITIKDIAKELQLTPAAVSMALADKDDISFETKQKVREAAEKMGYITNVSASSLRSGKSKIIAVVHDNILNPYFSIMINYLQEPLKKYGYSFLTFTERSGRLTGDIYKDIISRNVDGIISFIEPEEGLDPLITEYKTPLFLLGRKTNIKNVDYIVSDDEKGGRIAAERLFNDGCKKILYITESLEISCASDRFKGFKSESEKHAVYDEKYLVELKGNLLSEQLSGFIKSEIPFDGIVCFNDLLAFETLSILKKQGINDIKLVSFDNIQEAIRFPGQLTTVDSDKRQMAEVAVEVLMLKINNPTTKKFEKTQDVFLVDGETA